ncbi:MAG: ribbon-helix-helix domain-containing protein [Pseudolabrys sp.]|nr:ribbon-helix-helix domain-containing protein [Pseudolabrys sp.]
MPTTAIIKRSVMLNGVKTSVSLEEAFWAGLKDIARQRGKTIAGMLSEIGASKNTGNLSSAIRMFVFEHIRRRSGQP